VGLEIVGASAMRNVIESPRLVMREMVMDDAAFIFELLNEPAFIRFIGDRDIKNIEDAQAYIINGPQASYARHGFGLWLVERKDQHDPIGICGLIKREVLPDIDIGYAFLERFWSQGYAFEAARAVKDYAVHKMGIKRLVGVTNQDNWASIKVLEKIDLRYERLVKLAENGPDLKLFSAEF
jgi:RimJ/RimL family protein N-acetyltransferase